MQGIINIIMLKSRIKATPKSGEGVQTLVKKGMK
jgi:hypothetical protein